MSPKKQERLIFDNSCNCLFDKGVLEKAMLWWSEERILKKNRKIYMHGNYPAVSIFNEKLHVHRLIYCYENRKKLVRSIHVHHKDDDKLNSMTDNLEEIEGSLHMSHHNKGKKLSRSHKDKISKANKGRKGVKIKKTVIMPNLDNLVASGMSINAIARHYNCAWSTVRDRIHENPELLQGAGDE